MPLKWLRWYIWRYLRQLCVPHSFSSLAADRHAREGGNACPVLHFTASQCECARAVGRTEQETPRCANGYLCCYYLPVLPLVAVVVSALPVTCVEKILDLFATPRPISPVQYYTYLLLPMWWYCHPFTHQTYDIVSVIVGIGHESIIIHVWRRRRMRRILNWVTYIGRNCTFGPICARADTLVLLDMSLHKCSKHQTIVLYFLSRCAHKSTRVYL